MSSSDPSPQRPRPEPDTPPYRYTAALAGTIELRWQKHWEERGTFRTPNPGEPGFDPDRPKYYVLDMFPYPSGAGLHVGHPEGYTATDIVARYMRMNGRAVLHPMGWDAFGLPAEQYAIQTGVHPAITTRKAIDTFRGQLKRFGFSYDWSREVATIDEDYYRWTQWIFLKLYDAWYDREQDRARPIRELEEGLANGTYGVGASGEVVPLGSSIGYSLGLAPALEGTALGARRWAELGEDERRTFIDGQRLAYLGEQTVNWCPKLGTALANEEVIDGRSERGGFPVYRKPMRQWMFRITAYADRLLRDLALVDWPESTRAMQAEWIGRSEGAEIDFEIAGGLNGLGSLRVYTTRPDTIFGATYMVVAPEHPLVDRVLREPASETDAAALGAYVQQARNRTDVDRQESKEKTGVFTGVYAVNPATKRPIPVWTADYVLMGYGTGAIMAVPAHDERDHEFAQKFGLPTPVVVRPADGAEPDGCFAGSGVAVNSSNDEVSLDGLPTAEAKKKITDWLESKGLGTRKVNYRLRDWLFSRQRYWGEPFPIVFDEAGRHYPVSDAALPVKLPPLADYQPIESEDPVPLLAKATDWVNTTAGEAGVDPAILPPSTPVRRETNTMPGWAGSCWYFLRYCDPKNGDRFVGEEAERYWMGREGVDLYIGGAEHAVLHLLYARFWHKVLFDLGEVSTPEPFKKLFHQGLITSYAYQRPDKSLVPTDQVTETPDGAFVETATGKPLVQVIAKMSKSLKNVVNPDDVIAEYGADTFRLYEMYLGPLEASKPWNTRDIVGPFRFLQRAWRLAVDEETGELKLAAAADDKIERQLHRTIAKVGADIERLAFNTAIAAMIEFVNAATSAGGLTRDQLDRFVRILAPFAPHMAEELWSKLGGLNSISDAAWPAYDEAMLRESSVEYPVQVQGKVRGRITVPAEADAKAIEAAALADAKVQEFIAGRAIKKVIVVPGKMVNVVV